MIDADKIKQIVEATLLAADQPLTVDAIVRLFDVNELDREEARTLIRDSLKVLSEECEGRGLELKRVGSGYRYQVRQELSVWVSRLWEEKPPRYSRALLETLSLIAYKQPITRGDIEQVRGVSVSQNIMRTLLEREWVRVVGVREVPGRPSLYGTTKAFLDYFNLQSLDELPPLVEIRALIEPQMDLPDPNSAEDGAAEGTSTGAGSAPGEHAGPGRPLLTAVQNDTGDTSAADGADNDTPAKDDVTNESADNLGVGVALPDAEDAEDAADAADDAQGDAAVGDAGDVVVEESGDHNSGVSVQLPVGSADQSEPADDNSAQVLSGTQARDGDKSDDPGPDDPEALTGADLAEAGSALLGADAIEADSSEDSQARADADRQPDANEAMGVSGDADGASAATGADSNNRPTAEVVSLNRPT